MKKIGILLVNLGSPRSPDPGDVAKFLKEFLSDPKVVDLPALVRWILVNVIIVPTRSHRSAHAYEQIWTDRGSPLIEHTRNLTLEMGTSLGSDFVVAMAMRYGDPSFKKALKEFSNYDLAEIRIVPLFPQYAEATTGSVIAHSRKEFLGMSNLPVKIMKPFFHDSRVANLYAKRLGNSADYDHVVLSFHGLPVPQIRKTAAHAKSGCEGNGGLCCEPSQGHWKSCYRAQCVTMAHQIASAAYLERTKYTIAFQSRIGKATWIGPELNAELAALLHRGNRKIAVICPSFVADCLETLEEIQMRASEDFKNLGGESLTLIPSLNSDSDWVSVLTEFIRNEELQWFQYLPLSEQGVFQILPPQKATSEMME